MIKIWRFLKFFLGTILMVMVITGCPKLPSSGANQDGKVVERDTSSCAWPVSRKQYARDSSYIVLTAKGWMKADVTFYAQWKTLDSLDLLSVHVDTIIYDSTCKKLFSILGFGYAKTALDESNDRLTNCTRVFESRAMIGYLGAGREGWKLYDPDIFVGTSWCDSMELRVETFNIFLNELPRRQIGRTVKDESGKTVCRAEELKYSPLNCAFWTDSPFWKLGYRLPGYYSFEVHGNAGPVFPNSIKEPIVVQYPDSVLELFNTR
jgi:hypothetical protein